MMQLDPNEPFDSNNPLHKAWIRDEIQGVISTVFIGLPSLFAFVFLDSPWDIIVASGFIAAAAVHAIQRISQLLTLPHNPHNEESS